MQFLGACDKTGLSPLRVSWAGEESCAAAGSSCRERCIPSLRWELGTQHGICETPNDSAIKAAFAAIFQEFQRPF